MKRPGESGTGREKTRKVWNRKKVYKGSVELQENVQGLLPKIKKSEGDLGGWVIDNNKYNII
jgi:hypothetical protein